MVVRLLLTLLIFSFLAFATSFAGDFYKGKGEGYYQYYVKPPDKADKPEPDNITEEIFTPKEEKEDDNKSHVKIYVRPTVPPDEDLYIMPAQEFQLLYTDVLNYALTIRNLDTYADHVKMNKMANLRANEFGSLQVLYAQMYPEPENQYNRSLRGDEVDSTVAGRLLAERNNYALIYFYSPTCPYCAKTTPLLIMFRERYGWEIESVNIDEKPYMADIFEVTTTPSLRLLDRRNNVFILSNGLISLPEIEMRAYRYIRLLAGETTERTFSEATGKFGEGEFATIIER
jgi:conjugal transfer pilus assembly protein TraF